MYTLSLKGNLNKSFSFKANENLRYKIKCYNDFIIDSEESLNMLMDKLENYNVFIYNCNFNTITFMSNNLKDLKSFIKLRNFIKV